MIQDLIPMLSFIIPAHNEERLIGRTLASIHKVAGELGEPYEIVVVDDASTDATARIATEHGAKLVSVQHRQIAATRNAGARVATGAWFFFIDADTVLTRGALEAGLTSMRSGAVGGGCVFDFDCPLALGMRELHFVGITAGRWLKLVGGCCLFCTREAYFAGGGFDEAFYAGEELSFIRGLKRQGRFVVPRERVITSGRKLAQLSLAKSLALIFGILSGFKSLRKREGLELWYGPRPAAPPAAGPVDALPGDTST